MTKKLYLVFSYEAFSGLRFIGLYKTKRGAIQKKKEWKGFMQVFKLNKDESAYEAMGEVYV
jgi:hypothetical protein